MKSLLKLSNQEIAEEIESQEQEKTVPEPKKVLKTKEPAESPEDVFENLEKPEVEAVVDTKIHDDAKELFEESDIKAKVIEEEDIHEEDDILKFIPPKSTPAPEKPKPEEKPVAEAPKPVVEKKEVATKPAPKPETPKETPAPAQKPQQRSLNDLFNEQREDHSISSQYQRAKVGDLTKAISINDKFIYIKELFHNRGENFSASIRQLNECKTMEEAFDCLEELKQKFFWDSKSDAYLSFCDLLRRKYS